MDGVRQPTTWGPRVLVLAAAASAVWPSSWGPAQLTVGRVLLVAIAVAIAVDLIPVRGRVARPAWAVGGLIGALGGLLVWSAISAALWGCFCAGVVQGFGELVILTALVGVVGLYASPRWALTVVGAATLGALLGGLLAAVGLKDLHAAAFEPTESVARLEGVYGNPNFLGTALALALPAAAAAAIRFRGWPRLATIATALTLAGLLLATFSRGALLAAAVGVPLALVLASGWRPSRRTLLIVGVAIPLLAAAVFLSPFYRKQRLHADFGATQITSVASMDRSGWFTGQAGPVRVPGSTLSNPAGTTALRVDATRAGQGVSLELGQAFGTARAGWDFTATRPGRGAPLDVHWQVVLIPSLVVAEGVVHAGTKPRDVSARFRSVDGNRYMLHAWTTRPGAFVLADVALYERREGTAGGFRPLPTRLLGSARDALHEAEGGYERSRWTAVRLSGEAFLAQPLRGLGLNRFPAYAATHADYGPLPTHNTYLQVIAELGLVGILAMAAAIATLVAALRRGRRPTLLGAALAGTLATAAVDLLFINGLSSPGMAMPLIVAMGLTVAWAGPTPQRLRDLRQRLRRPQPDPDPAAETATKAKANTGTGTGTVES